MAILCLALPGCSGCNRGIDSRYGRRSGAGATSSVNGTAVLAEMFERYGHRVHTHLSLSPRIRARADCIVWFPNDFRPPSSETCDWIDNWLAESPGRTLIYVGRDFDAASFYWRKIRPQAPPEQKKEVIRRLQEAESEFQSARATLTGVEQCELFALDGRLAPRQVRTLQGDPYWLEGVDPSGVEIELNGRLTPPGWAEVLLESDEDVLVSLEYRGDGQVIVVANGSFLLNLPLVNREHRKLAGKLIGELGPPGQTVVFLESGPGGPRVLEEDPGVKVPTGMEIFHTWPASWILIHASLLGILFCFWRFPIFGRPRDPQPESQKDFGRHIEALGELLEQSQDRSYAMSQVLHYQQSVRARERPQPE